MEEIYKDISPTVKKLAEQTWTLTQMMKLPTDTADFLANVTAYYSHLLTEEEMDFFRFYINMKLKEAQNNL